MHSYKTAWYSIRPLVSTHDFGDVLEAPKGGLGRAQQAGVEASYRALEDSSGKEGELEVSGAERACNIDHTPITVNHLKAWCTK